MWNKAMITQMLIVNEDESVFSGGCPCSIKERIQPEAVLIFAGATAFQGETEDEVHRAH